MEELIDLHKKSAILLMIDCPEKIQIGMDNISLKTGSKFKGIKYITTGAHFIYYTLGDENNMFKTSFFIYAKPGDVFVRKWNDEAGEFVPIEGQEEGERYISASKNMEMDPYLANYPYEKVNLWNDLSKYITREVVERLEPVQKKIYSTRAEYSSDEKNEAKEEFGVIRGTIFFTDIPKNYNAPGLSPEEKTKKNLDKTFILEELFKKSYGNNIHGFFGELQFAFVLFILAENVEGFHQWKRMIILMAFADDLAYKSPETYCEFIPIIFAQLQQFPKEFFIDSVTSDNFLSSCLKNILDMIFDDKILKKLRSRISKLKTLLEEKFEFKHSFEFGELELGEDAPQLVEDFNFIKLDD